MILFEEENSYLPIKTVAEYFFCERAAFYMLTAWENNFENPFLYKGGQEHRTIDKIPYKHRSAAKIVYRHPVVSNKLRIYGFCDAVEFDIKGKPKPIEYKTGKVRQNIMHRVQLYLQAVCLGEMYRSPVVSGAIYFIGSRCRIEVMFSEREMLFILDKIKEFRYKIAQADIREFRACGSSLCSYSAIDEPVLYQ